jgi:glycosyltransferase 2 family protein
VSTAAGTSGYPLADSPSTPASVLRSIAGHRVARTVRGAIPLLLLAALIARVGAAPYERSLHVLTPVPIVAALLLGVVTTVAQAMRWRTVALAYGAASGLTRGRAVREYYRSSLLNAVLPGGVVGDGVRAWRQRPASGRGLRPGAQALRSSAQAVVVERVVGTMLLLLAVAVVTFPLETWLSGAMLAGAAVAGAIAVPGLGRVPARARAAVLGWSLLAMASLVTKFVVASVALGTVRHPGEVVTLALIVLAGMSLPFGVGGFGPREAVAAVAFTALGLSADAGVATSAAYGVLAAVSTAPGVLVMLLDSRRDDPHGPAEDGRDPRREGGAGVRLAEVGRAREPVAGGVRTTGRREVELEADVLAEEEPARRSA